MRSLLILALATAPYLVIAADAPAPAAADAKAVNTVCVMCGKPVDAAIKPVAAKTADGKEIMIGCCSEKCAGEVKKSPDTYAAAAVANKQWKKDESIK